MVGVHNKGGQVAAIAAGLGANRASPLPPALCVQIMKSGKQRKAEIKRSRLERMEKRDSKVNPFKGPIPEWAIPVNPAEVVYHSMFLDIPLFYIDKEFVCKDCSASEIWTARQQKWWYEVAKGNFETTAVRCRACRDRRKAEKDVQQKHMEEMAKRKPHPNEVFFKNT